MAGEKILVIDDSDALRSLLASVLPFAGYEAISASTGQEGLRLVSEVEPDVILTDLELPDMSGLKVLEDLNDRGFSIPTIMMTGYGSEGIAARALKLGVRDYLIKPFTTEEVLSSIERALSENRLRRENVRLAAHVRACRREIKMLAAIGRALHSGLDLDQVLQRIVEASRFATGGEAAMLLERDEDSRHLCLVASDGAISDPEHNFPIRSGDQDLWPVLAQGQSARLCAPVDEVLELQNGDRVKAALQVPLRMGDEVCGLLSVDRRTRDAAFEAHDEDLLSILAEYASTALRKRHESAASPAQA